MLRFLGLGGSNMDVDQEPEDKEKEQASERTPSPAPRLLAMAVWRPGRACGADLEWVRASHGPPCRPREYNTAPGGAG